ncbi:hypothetical protein BsWGS_20944 [Bradybaena similaris]
MICVAGIASTSRSPALTSILTLTLGFVSAVHAIDCYKCTSINEMNDECEDKFDTGMGTVQLIERECFYGLFRGTHCIKFKGEREDGTKVIVRDCSDSDWGSHCGDIRYLFGDKEQMITGCLAACSHDGCNTAAAHAPSCLLVTCALVAMVMMTFLTQNFHELFSS